MTSLNRNRPMKKYRTMEIITASHTGKLPRNSAAAGGKPEMAEKGM